MMAFKQGLSVPFTTSPSALPASSPTLTLRRVGLHTYSEYVAFLSSVCSAYKPESFININKIEIHGQNGRSIIATLNIVENGDLLDPYSVRRQRSLDKVA
jgi:hypothetical protein